MSEKDDGGPAFPIEGTATPYAPSPRKGRPMSDLLPCPFCGTVPELRTTYGSEVVGYAGHYEIRCPRCFVTHSGRDKQNPAGGYALEVGKADAIAAWNRRAPITVQQAAKVLLDHLNTLRAFEEGTDR